MIPLGNNFQTNTDALLIKSKLIALTQDRLAMVFAHLVDNDRLDIQKVYRGNRQEMGSPEERKEILIEARPMFKYCGSNLWHLFV